MRMSGAYNDVVVKHNNGRLEIVGASLINILRGLFQCLESVNDKNVSLEEFRSIIDHDLSIKPWSELLEPVCINLVQVCPIDDILVCVQQEIEFHSGLHGWGSIMFLNTWVVFFASFLSVQNLVSIQAFIEFQHHKLSQSSDENNAQLLLLMQHLAVEVKLALQTKVVHELRLDSNYGPYTRFVEGNWIDNDISESQKPVKTTHFQSQVKLEIFGAEALFDDSTDATSEDGVELEEETRRGARLKSGDTSLTSELSFCFPRPRIHLGVSVIKAPDSLPDLTRSIDVVEMARQWTLVDHELFRNISLHGVLCYCGISPGFDSLSKSASVDSIKQLVDRFNASSLWVAHFILAGETPVVRAKTIEYFIGLSVCLLRFCNFHGMMSILTALQQGCISRLTQSFALVPEASLNQLQKMKV